MTDAALEQALHKALPTQWHPSIPILTQVLLAARDGQAALVSTDTLEAALRHLQGSTLASKTGNISVRNIQGDGIAIGHGAQATVIRIYVPHTEAQKRAWRNRTHMLEKVHSIWIEGYLEQSFHVITMIDPGMQYIPDALFHPWEILVQSPDRPYDAVPSEQKIGDVFAQFGGELLILGGPGTGKTTTLLELTRILIERAQNDERLAIPVVFHLSSWAQKQSPLAVWLVDELRQRYDVPLKIAQEWISHEHVLPLLDGLDEVQERYRQDCITAIHAFRQEHGLAGLVVCSRQKEYETLKEKLRLQGAILLRPLIDDQIKNALHRLGEQSQTAYAVMKRLQDTAREYQDENALALMHTPLMLYIVALASQKNTTSPELLAMMSPNAQQKHIFDIYATYMFLRKKPNDLFSQERSRHWLEWLARTLQQHDQTTLFIELMQPNWLPPSRWLSFDRWVGFMRGALVGLAVANFFILVLMILIAVKGMIAWLTHISFALVLLTLMIIFIINIAIFGSIGIFAAKKEPIPETISLVEKLEIPQGAIRSAVIRGLAFSIPAAIILSLGWAWLGVLAGICTGGAVGALLIGRTMNASQQSMTRFTPNQGVWHSARNALLVSLIGGGMVGIALGILTGITMTTELGLLAGLCAGLMTSIFAALFFGFETFFKHFLLRAMLIREGSIPQAYVPFLNDATERIFLRKVGGGYIFVHRLLMEYFANHQTQTMKLPHDGSA